MAQEYPLPPTYKTSDPASLAYDSARRRWPVILTGAIDDMYRSVSACEQGDKCEEGKRITEALARLKYELQHGRPLTPLPDDGASDIALYNARLEELGAPPWMDVEWLYSECYLYRRMHTLFSLSTHWKTYDVFARQKIKTFRSSRPAVLELAARYKHLILKTMKDSVCDTEDVEREKLLFIEMCEICLWGNATDLALLTNLTYDDIQKLQGSAARKAAEKNIVVNDLPRAFEILHKAKAADQQKCRVDIVLDNSGFELFVDLVLAGYLLAADLATEVVLHPKRLPWFVSDVLPTDFDELLASLDKAKKFYETPSDDEELTNTTPAPLAGSDESHLQFLYKDWSGLHRDKKIVLRPDEYWTRGTDFRNLATDNPQLAADLRQSNLVIFKGDLNYRKLTGDAAWDPTIPFDKALGALGAAGINILTLRTCKADVVVGLEAGMDERLKAMDGGSDDKGARKWGWNGKWAVVSLCEGKKE